MCSEVVTIFDVDYVDWKLDELADVLYLFKTIQLDPNYRNNYKELARRMVDAGWQRDNDQCRHQVNEKVPCLRYCIS